MIRTRKATAQDLSTILRLFVSTIEAINSKDYSAEQIKVWKAGASKTGKWLDKIAQQYFLLAEINNVIAGFGSITDKGYLDFMYISKDHQRMGVAKHIYDELESFARSNHLNTIISDVSITAKPFFEKHGFTTVQEQEVMIDGIALRNYRMEKHLSF